MSDPGALRADVAVVGAGAAGLFTALVAAEAGARVALVSRSALAESASYWAQGGIAAALAPDDSTQHHLDDTLRAGRGAARESTARVLCEESAARVRELERLGVSFDAEAGALALGLEGGHSRRRIVHAGGSATGRRITHCLSALAADHEHIDVYERTTADALWTHDGRCVGAVVRSRGGEPRSLLGRATVLATGGSAALWQRTTNPLGATGAGLTLAQAAGAELADLEFMQFHPTALAHDGPRDGFLVTEAVRGEGATLHDAAGDRFVDELAPRDEVALAIEAELRQSGAPAVQLDMRSVELSAFPNIAEVLGEVGIDPRCDTVPVAPAAHYAMGGVATDVHGRSSLPGLLAVGECACTGLHGANRLASNSLAECMVFGRRAALAAIDEPAPPSDPGPTPAEAPAVAPPPETRQALWRDAGLERDAAGLKRLAGDRFPLARLIAASCLTRAESRGAHQRSDHPDTDPTLDRMHTTVGRDSQPALVEWA